MDNHKNERIIITGAKGLVGTALTKALLDLGFEVIPYKSRCDGKHCMNHETGTIDKDGLEGAYAVIHLAGESIAQAWTNEAKNRIMSSRRDNTLLLANTLAHLKEKPKVLISMSGISRYGLHRPEVLDETSPVMVDGFLSEVAEAWESSTIPCQQSGIRTVLLRTPMVLSASEGGLSKMLPAFRLNLGGPINGGAQKMSWIGLPDLVSLIIWAMKSQSISGPLNAASPGVVSQAEFARALGAAVNRWAFIPMPGFAISLLFGQMGEETILGDLAVGPTKALASGFQFSTPDLPSALAQALQSS